MQAAAPHGLWRSPLVTAAVARVCFHAWHAWLPMGCTPCCHTASWDHGHFVGCFRQCFPCRYPCRRWDMAPNLLQAPLCCHFRSKSNKRSAPAAPLWSVTCSNALGCMHTGMRRCATYHATSPVSCASDSFSFLLPPWHRDCLFVTARAAGFLVQAPGFLVAAPAMCAQTHPATSAACNQTAARNNPAGVP